MPPASMPLRASVTIFSSSAAVGRPARGGDAAAADTDVGRKPWIAAAVEDAAVSNQHVVPRRRLCERRRGEREYADEKEKKDEPWSHGVIFAQTRQRWRDFPPPGAPSTARSSGRPTLPCESGGLPAQRRRFRRPRQRRSPGCATSTIGVRPA